MSEYNRATRECPVSQLHPELRQAVRNYFQEHELGDMETETLLCCETISEKKTSGRLGSWMNDSLDTTIHTGMLLTSQWLIWARYGDKTGVLVTAANLELLSARVYTSIIAQDTGLEIFGYIVGFKGQKRGYIGMGSEPAAQKFCDEVMQAIIRLNPPPPPKKWPKWLGGK
jgi:hypothetical protein